MQLLVITNNSDRASFRQRIGVHLDLFRRRGIVPTIVTLPTNPLARRAVFASAQSFDSVLLHRKMLSVWEAFCLRGYGEKVVYDFDDAIMYSDRHPERRSRLRLARFRRSVGVASMILAGNDYLAEHARRYSANVHVLPTGLEAQAYRTACPRQDDGLVRLVWIGSRSTLKYLREIGPALEEIGRQFPHVVLRLICDEFFDLKSMRVEKRPWSKAAEAEDLCTSDIGLAPLPENRFTRGKCGFKILQYQAAGLPVVASPVGVNAQYVRDGVTGYLARNLPQWVDRLRALVENSENRTSLGCCGRREAERFDVSIVGERLCRLVTECRG
jgi:glycosyltransferase involved in cell wall biosynthesis